MTSQWYNILAAKDDGMINILILVVMMVIGLIGHLIKKAQEKQQVEEANRKVEQAKQRHATEARPGHVQTKPPPLAPVRPPVPVIHAAADLGQGVSQEMVQVRQQLAAKKRQQQKRLVTVKPLHPAIGAAATSAEGTSLGEPKIHLNLTSSKAAKTAIICAEVLGPPKSLRTNPEPWDM